MSRIEYQYEKMREAANKKQFERMNRLDKRSELGPNNQSGSTRLTRSKTPSGSGRKSTAKEDVSISDADGFVHRTDRRSHNSQRTLPKDNATSRTEAISSSGKLSQTMVDVSRISERLVSWPTITSTPFDSMLLSYMCIDKGPNKECDAIKKLFEESGVPKT